MPTDTLLRVVFAFLAGLASLWIEVSGLRLLLGVVGSGQAAFSGVLAVFLVGQAIGALLVGRAADRAGRPALLFALSSLLAAAATAAAPLLAGRAGEALAALLWTPGDPFAHGLVAVAGAAAALLLPAVLTGGLVSSLVADGRRVGRSESAALYAASTAGAVLGVLSAHFVLLPEIGVRATLFACAALLAALGLSTWLTLGGREAGGEGETSPGDAGLGAGERPAAARAFVAGFALLGAEVCALRVARQWLDGSATSSAVVLAVFVGAVAPGVLLGARSARRGWARRTGGVWLAAGAVSLAVAGLVADRWFPEPGTGLAATANAGVALTGLFAPAAALLAAALGALFAGRTAGSGSGYGLLVAAHTLGGVSALTAVPYLVVPTFGLRGAFFATGLVAAAGLAGRPVGRTLPRAGAVAAAVAAALAGADLRFVPHDPAFPRLLALVEGPDANVAVLEAPGGRRPVLYVDRTARQGGGDFVRWERRQGLLPALVSSKPDRVLALGLGTGETVKGLLDGGARHVEAVEVVGGVVDVLGHFTAPGEAGLLADPRVRVLRDDAVSYVKRVGAQYDLVVGDLFFPWQEGAGRLYSLEHFREVRRRLASDGTFWQWLPLHQMRWEDFGVVARTFARAFPDVCVFLLDPVAPFPIVALVGSEGRIEIDLDALARRLEDERLGRAAAALGLREPLDVVELYLGDRYTIDAAFLADEELGAEPSLTTLDLPIVEYRVARHRRPDIERALENFNNVALHLGGSILSRVRTHAQESADRDALGLRLNRRLDARTQWVLGHYWRLRRSVEPEEAESLEALEATRYLAGLRFDPEHPGLRDEVRRLAAERLRDRKFSEAFALAQAAWTLTADPAFARTAATAALLLGEDEKAVELLEPLVSEDGGEPTDRMLLGMARFLLGQDEQARAELDRAFAESGGQVSGIAQAMRAWLHGSDEEARRRIEPLLDHPVWGALARRASKRRGAG